MSAEVLLRRYLRQRAELGEREIVLDRFTPGELVELLRAAASARDSVGREPAPAPAVAARATVAPAEPGDSGVAAAPPVAAPPVAAPSGVVPVDGSAVASASLDELRAAALGCRGCALCDGRNSVVFGEGDPHASVMIVGEAPGAEEDRTGRPFVGRAGRLLDVFLESVGFTRESVYICNVLKCRPPANRNPEPAEIEACGGYLRRQIELVDPAVVLAVGTFAAQTLLGSKESITRLRGRTHDMGGRPLIATYHPAAVLRNPSWIRPVWEDLQRLRDVLSSA